MITERNIQYLKGVGEKRAKLFERLGVGSVGALLRFYPRAYEDWSTPCSLAEAALSGDARAVEVTVTEGAVERRVRGGMVIYRASAGDGVNGVTITLFNNRFAAARLKYGAKLLLFGKFTGGPYNFETSSPQIGAADDGRMIHPIYRATEGLSSKTIERAAANALSLVGDGGLPDPLPAELRERYTLCPLYDAIKAIHFPQSMDDIRTARRRLVFEELMTLRMGMTMLRKGGAARNGYVIDGRAVNEFWGLLPFSPTSAQRRAVDDALRDMSGGTAMNRLLQGDVGSGKTAVAAALCFCAAKSGVRCAMMAPTEILAAQHFRSLSSLLAPAGVRVCLLTGSMTKKEKAETRRAVSAGEYDVVIGTHALIQSSVTIDRLGLVITDEQHRFGVKQRAALAEKGTNPHLLVMSATPIPRTLSLIIYGDLDISVLDEMPAGRKEIKTYAISGRKRERAFAYIKRALDSGRQAYIVCPTVDGSDTPLAAVSEYYERVTQKDFRDYRVGLLHGRLKAAEKDRVMSDFAAGKIDLLIATTVVEVGVDVPNATVMMIENAERFGLSQLHQLRGRVGRGEYQSDCILVSDARGEDAVRRLKTMCATGDGFAIADEDLKLRGPGDFFGSRQHGLPMLKIADLNNDMELLTLAASAADELIASDPKLEKPQHRALADLVNELFASAYTA